MTEKTLKHILATDGPKAVTHKGMKVNLPHDMPEHIRHAAHMHDSGERLAAKGRDYAKQKRYGMAGLLYNDAGDHHEIRDHLRKNEHDLAKSRAHGMDTASRDNIHPDTAEYLGFIVNRKHRK